jgi:hypothetical protein
MRPRARLATAEGPRTAPIALRSGRQGARSAEDLDADLGGGLTQDGRVERAPGRRQLLGTRYLRLTDDYARRYLDAQREWLDAVQEELERKQ